MKLTRPHVRTPRFGRAAGIALDRVVDVPADKDSLTLSIIVDLSAGTRAKGERMALRLRFIAAATPNRASPLGAAPAYTANSLTVAVP